MAITASIRLPPCPPSLCGSVIPMSPCLAHELRDVEGKLRIVRALERARREMFARKTLHRIGELLLLGREVEIHD